MGELTPANPATLNDINLSVEVYVQTDAQPTNVTGTTLIW